MFPFILVVSAVSAHTFSLHSQLSAHQQSVLQRQDLVSQLSRARAQLLNSTHTADFSTSFIELVDETPLDSFFARLIRKADFEVRTRGRLEEGM